VQGSTSCLTVLRSCADYVTTEINTRSISMFIGRFVRRYILRFWIGRDAYETWCLKINTSIIVRNTSGLSAKAEGFTILYPYPLRRQSYCGTGIARGHFVTRMDISFNNNAYSCTAATALVSFAPNDASIDHYLSKVRIAITSYNHKILLYRNAETFSTRNVNSPRAAVAITTQSVCPVAWCRSREHFIKLQICIIEM
jgi:hypothetical protein